MKRRRFVLALTVALIAVAGLALQCGDDANVVARQIRDYISNVGTPGGTAQGTLVEGQPPSPNGGPTPTVAAGSSTVSSGGGASATISADVPFATILVAVSGASDYYQVDLPLPVESAEILIGMGDDIPDSGFTFEYAVASGELLGVFVGVPVTVTPGEDGPRCGDGLCNGGETTETCSQDCAAEPVCGDGLCNGGETTATCSQDCPAEPVCGDGTCNGSETTATCSQDCPAACTPDCRSRQCGDDGCDGSCGDCLGAQDVCNDAGQCVCQPDCADAICGVDDGCGGICEAGSCSGGGTCTGGQCIVDVCLFGCEDAFNCDQEFGVPAALACHYFPGGLQGGCANVRRDPEWPDCEGFECPDGFQCRGIRCIPLCATDEDCPGDGQQCLGINSPDTEDFSCSLDVQPPEYASACGADGSCPDGYTCQGLRVEQ